MIFCPSIDKQDNLNLLFFILLSNWQKKKKFQIKKIFLSFVHLGFHYRFIIINWKLLLIEKKFRNSCLEFLKHDLKKNLLVFFQCQYKFSLFNSVWVEINCKNYIRGKSRKKKKNEKCAKDNVTKEASKIVKQ